MKLHNRQEYTIYLGRPGMTEVRELAGAVTDFGPTAEFSDLENHVYNLMQSAYSKGRSLIDGHSNPIPEASPPKLDKFDLSSLSHFAVINDDNAIIKTVVRLVNEAFNKGYAEVGGLNPNVINVEDF